VSRPRDEDYLGPTITIIVMIIRAMARRIGFGCCATSFHCFDLEQLSRLYSPIVLFHGNLLRHSTSIVCLDDLGFYVLSPIHTASLQVAFLIQSYDISKPPESSFINLFNYRPIGFHAQHIFFDFFPFSSSSHRLLLQISGRFPY